MAGDGVWSRPPAWRAGSARWCSRDAVQPIARRRPRAAAHVESHSQTHTEPTTTGKRVRSERARGPQNVYAHDAAGDLSPTVREDPALVYVPNSLSNTVDEISQRTFKIVRELEGRRATATRHALIQPEDAVGGQRRRQLAHADQSPERPSGKTDPGRGPLQHVLHAGRPLRDRRRRAAASARLSKSPHDALVHSLAVPECSGSTTWTSRPTVGSPTPAASSPGRMIEIDLAHQRVDPYAHPQRRQLDAAGREAFSQTAARSTPPTWTMAASGRSIGQPPSRWASSRPAPELTGSTRAATPRSCT